MSGAGGRARWIGVVLCGGASTRMGRDKATMGRPWWAHRVAGALHDGGCPTVQLQGGDPALATPRFEHFEDSVPGGGPSPAVVQACARNSGVAMVIAGCDLPFLEAPDVRELMAHSEAARASRVPPLVHAYRSGRRANWSLSVLDRTTVERLGSIAPRAVADSPLGRLFSAQARVHEPPDPERTRDVDDPADLLGQPSP